jgi:hypothetical protein
MSEPTAKEKAGWAEHVLAKDKIKNCDGHDRIIEKLLNQIDRLEAERRERDG